VEISFLKNKKVTEFPDCIHGNAQLQYVVDNYSNTKKKRFGVFDLNKN